jgi:hypothetical protein
MRGRELLERLRADELSSISANVGVGLTEQILKSLDERGSAQELIKKQYTGRYPFELLQNANDAAADADVTGQVLFELTETALLVADQGSGFGEQQIRSICRLAHSSKDPRKSVGYKGLGFKSVGEITSTPQVFSVEAAFGFDAVAAQRDVQALTGPFPDRQRLPVYAFPMILGVEDAGPDAERVRDLMAGGFNTVMRLPLATGVERAGVQEHLRSTIVPRLLLLLDATIGLELRGTPNDFAAFAVREEHDGFRETLLEWGAEPEHWRVYRRSLDIPDRRLLEPLGEAWRLVDQVHVAVGVRMDRDGHPGAGSSEPIHIYFPTEDTTGFPLILNADFELELDRRHVARTPEAREYNQWLTDELADLVATTAAGLSSEFPGDASVVAALTPRSHATGFGQDVRDAIVTQLAQTAYVPLLDGAAAKPSDARLLPDSIGDPESAHRVLNASGLPMQVIWQVEADTEARAFLKETLQSCEGTLDEVLAALREPAAEDDDALYELLVRWAEKAGSKLPAALRTTPCVRTMGGGWVEPASGVFFARQRGDLALPEGLQIPIADLPEVPGLRQLLEAAGVQPFEWRQLITDFILPRLTNPEADREESAGALEALRAFHLTVESGDARLRTQIAGVLLPARMIGGDVGELRPAGALYFPHAWTGRDSLERLYGPFGRAEFLNMARPDDAGEREDLLAFLSWLGVADRPRVDQAVADQRDMYMVGSLARHPHSSYAPHWRQWQESEAFEAASNCDQGHAYSQQLRSSFALDRLPELAASGDPARMRILWEALARDWDTYAPAMHSVIRCQHTRHGDSPRRVPSLLAYMLMSLSWVPSIVRGTVATSKPSAVWRVTRDTPSGVAERVAVLDPQLDAPRSSALIAALDLVDAARPKPVDLIGLLTSLEEELKESEASEGRRPMYLAARWAMRSLNDAIQLGTSYGPVPLLARHCGETVFASDPLVSADPLLAETWEPVFPILDADKDLRTLHRALGLRMLEDVVETSPKAIGIRSDIKADVDRWLAEVKPYLAATAIDSTPSREAEVLRGLTRLETIVCDELVLYYEFDGIVRSREEAVCHIAARTEQHGSTRQRIGTAYLELDPRTRMPHWYVVGPQLANYLGVPPLADAFGLLLSASPSDRLHYLTSRRIGASEVESARAKLAMPPVDLEIEDLLQFPEGSQEDETSTVVISPEGSADLRVGVSPGPLAADLPLPDVDFTQVTLVAGLPSQSSGNLARHPSTRGRLGAAGHIDFDTIHHRQGQRGRRGEEVAFKVEQRRLLDLGLDPNLVRWISQTHETAPYDLESVDADGQRIFIEVKSTSMSEPGAPFEISQAELLMAAAERSRYYIYRVTDVDTEAPHVTHFQDPIGILEAHAGELKLSGARMSFHMDSAGLAQ